MTPKLPSARQLNYLKALANRTGQTFTYPKTSRAASRAIQRLKTVRPTSRIELELERLDVAAEQAAREGNCDVRVGLSEIEGYGSTRHGRASRKLCRRGLMVKCNSTPCVSISDVQRAVSGTRSPKWILNASSAVVQFRVRVHCGTAFCRAR
jgi:hypothetical protein